jgi:hypothetical protein
MTNWHNVKADRCVLTVGCGPSGNIFPIRCGSWDCAICAPINALHWAIKVREGCRILREAGETLHFALFTFDGTISAEESYKRLPGAWDKLRRKLERHAKKAGVAFEYCTFVESQKRGHAHLHIITNLKASKSLAKEWAKASGFGHFADWQPVKTEGAVAWYISKYCAKPSQKQGMPKGFRRVRMSQGWPKVVLEVEKSQGQAIVMERGESPLEFAFRCKTAFPALDFDDIMEQTHNALFKHQQHAN